MLVSGGREEDGSLWVVKVLLLFWIIVTGSIDIQECAFLKYKEMTRPKDTVNGTFGCVCIRCSTDDKVNDRMI